ncbi:MAG: hypothetical protein ACRD72_02060 [Candidatus Angelobacter sp.]
MAQDASVAGNSPSTGTLKNREEFEDQSYYLDSMSKTGDAQARRHNNTQQNATGPRRFTLLPLDASAFEGVSGDDKKWLDEQEARFASDSEGLATKPNFALLSFEAVNFMDGHRSTAEIADLLSAEYLLDIDQAWVDRLVSILQKQKLVSAN